MALAFDLDELKQLKEHTGQVCDTLKTESTQLKTGLETLRKDWNTPAGSYFFSNIDGDWESEVKKFEDTLLKFQELIGHAIEEFEKVVEKAAQLNIDL